MYHCIWRTFAWSSVSPHVPIVGWEKTVDINMLMIICRFWQRCADGDNIRGGGNDNTGTYGANYNDNNDWWEWCSGMLLKI